MSIRLHMLSASWSGTVCASGLTVLLVGVSLAGCGGALQVQGSVLDSENRPVVGATIDAAPLSTFSEWSARFHAQSNGDGCFALAGTVSPFPTRQAPLTVSAPGYKPVTAEMQSPSSNRVIVTLARKDSSEQSRVVILLRKDSVSPCPSLQMHSLTGH
jgi:Carboxypeptidase regulatory-like domain